MAFPQYPDHQPPAVPWPTDYDDQRPEQGKRSPVLGASIAGLVAVLVLAVGVLLGLQLSGSDPVQPQPSSPSPSFGASPPSSAPPTTEPELATIEAERRRALEAARLDRSTYESVSAREFALMAKNPDSWAGRKIVVYGVITQFDAATGTTTFRADTGPAPAADPYDYDQNTFITAHDAGMVANFVETDMVTMFVEVQGAFTYDTQIGGSTTVPSLQVNIIETTNLSSPSARALPPSVGPAPLPDIESASGSQLRAIAASDQPIVFAGLAERWVPQLSSKRPGLVAEGQTWTNAMTLAEHEQLRQTYPGVRLLWSGDWSTFSESNFWVTIVGTGFPTADGALAWCTSSGFDRDHCYAKLISTTHPVDGSTDYN
ncbi:hypothetical protein [Mycobacterium sp.]|uniref:hypothetical protein n=1 Tax=Mycobacterium sp. TaxID=1785 RepID=UPI002D8E7C89|nr:hypothetical protein [Mycobacterium sp.]